MSEKKSNGTEFKDLWIASRVAKYLNVSRSWVYDRASAGELPHLRFGGNLRFDPNEIAAYARGEWVARPAKVLPLHRGRK